jgi:arginyl-tRNA synthetase
VQTEKSITFKWEDALNFEGDTAPFVQYAHARASSILRKAAEGGAAPRSGEYPHPSEMALVKAIAKLPFTVKLAAEERKIHLLPSYAVELASAFNAFYRDCPVMVDDDAVRAPRLALVRAAKTALQNTLGLLGIEAPDAM